VRAKWVILPLVGVASAGLATLYALSRSTAPRSAPALHLEADQTKLLANGATTARVKVRVTGGEVLAPKDVTLEIVEGQRRARIEYITPRGTGVDALVRAGIQPGAVTFEARAAGMAPARLRLATVFDPSDRAGDGTPDFLRLDDAGDREAFRRWFTFLAEVQAVKPAAELPAEIDDCAALLRFAYREALREHDGEWAGAIGLPALPQAAAVKKYAYPYTPLGAGLFRVREGAFRAPDASNGAFAQFADAETLRLRNTHFITRDIRLAQPGDVLFFRQLEQDLPFHAMIFLGPSQLEPGVQNWVVYHTGPLDDTKGEIRRVKLNDLLRHPSPRWRPVPGNANFLGVYRWNILRRE